MDTQLDQLTIQQVAEATGLSTYTLRYYERIGLIHPIDRAQNTHRRYTLDDIGWIEFLNKLRATGMSIQQMQRYAELQRQGDETLPERVEMLRMLQREAEARIAEVSEHLKLIRYKIGLYESIIQEQQPRLERE
ncbi:MAG: MerR family transcriptional regulator [Chloroflexi bacterium]|nr:MerR family transcriptional regulator [Chloroflexota bacterium]